MLKHDVENLQSLHCHTLIVDPTKDLVEKLLGKSKNKRFVHLPWVFIFLLSLIKWYDQPTPVTSHGFQYRPHISSINFQMYTFLSKTSPVIRKYPSRGRLRIDWRLLVEDSLSSSGE